MIMHGAETFFFRGGTQGVILIHGFTGSPAELRPLGEHLAAAGYTVLGVRLPGHGTRPEELERTTKTDWQCAVLDAYEILAAQCQEIFACGLSMGAWLAMWLATVRHLQAVVSLSAPVFLHESGQLKRLPAREDAQGKFLPRPHKAYPGMDGKYLVCYNVMPLVSIHELLGVMAEGKELLPQLQVPLLVVQSKNDHTVKAESGQYIIEHSGSVQKKLLLLEKSGHRVTLDCERNILMQEISDFLQSF